MLLVLCGKMTKGFSTKLEYATQLIVHSATYFCIPMLGTNCEWQLKAMLVAVATF